MFSVIFDMDGTLLNTQRVCMKAWDYAGARQGFENVGDSVLKICGMTEPEWTAYIIEHNKGIDIDLFYADADVFIKRTGGIPLRRGAQKLLDFLKSNNVKMAVASSSPKQVVIDNLKAVGALDYFSVAIGGDEVERGKPAPDIFLKAAELLGTRCDNCFIFEDSSTGARAAINANIKCIGVPDVLPFADDVKPFLFKEFTVIDKAIEVLKEYL